MWRDDKMSEQVAINLPDFGSDAQRKVFGICECKDQCGIQMMEANEDILEPSNSIIDSSMLR